MPQMTAQVVFVAARAPQALAVPLVALQGEAEGDQATVRVRMVDSVGYLVEGALGTEEDGTDGVLMPSELVAGSSYTIPVAVDGSGTITAAFDWNDELLAKTVWPERPAAGEIPPV